MSMELEQVKRNLNKMVVYKGIPNIYKLTACTLRKNEEGFFYQVELQDTKNKNSVIIGGMKDIDEVER